MFGFIGQAGPWQLLIVVLLVVLVFGAKKIPEIARSLGRASGEFKKGVREGNAAAAEKSEALKKSLLKEGSEEPELKD